MVVTIVIARDFPRDPMVPSAPMFSPDYNFLAFPGHRSGYGILNDVVIRRDAAA